MGRCGIRASVEEWGAVLPTDGAAQPAPWGLSRLLQCLPTHSARDYGATMHGASKNPT